MNRLRAALVGGIVVIVLAVAGLATGILGAPPERHADGAGPLASRNGPGSESMAVDPDRAGGSSWTYGVRLCLSAGSDPVVIDSVGPSKSVGTGYRYLGAKIRTFSESPSHAGIISVNGYPPPTSYVPDPLVAAIGSRVTTACTATGLGPYTELLVGLELTSLVGGGWQGIDIGYTAAGRHRILEIDQNFLICGTSVSCAIPTPPPAA